ncbi:hypothetical protein ACH3XW_42015 [Acanthocheilonema viteae]
MIAKKEEKNGKVAEKEPELISNHGRVRSRRDEEALDKKIAEIRKKNQLIEQRKELVEEDRANFVNECGEMRLYDGAKGTMYRNKETLKPKKPGEWDREWDVGKTSVENWKENVPDIDNNKKTNVHFLRRLKSYSNGGKWSNNVTSKKIVEIKEKKQKFEGPKVITRTETNKNTSLPNKKIFNGENSKNLKSSDSGNNGGTVLRNTHCMKPVSGVKQPRISSNGQSNRQPTRSYKKSSSGPSRKRYSTRRIASTAVAVPVPVAVKKHLDTVKVNVSMLELKKDAAETIAKSNNNMGKVDNNLQKLSTVVVDVVAASTAPTPPIVEEYGN